MAGLLCALLLLLAPQIARAQTEKPPTLSDLQAYLLTANEALMTLVPLSQDRESRIASLRIDLALLSTQLQTSEASSLMLTGQLTDSSATLGISEAARLKALSSLDALSTRFTALSVSFSDYKKEMQGQVQDPERARNLWQAVTWSTSGAAAGALAGAAIGKDAGSALLGAASGAVTGWLAHWIAGLIRPP